MLFLFLSLFEINYSICSFLIHSFICFCLLLKRYVYCIPAISFPFHSLWRSHVKLVLFPRYNNILSETLQLYKFIVIFFIVDAMKSMKSIILKVWKIKSHNEILGVVRPPWDCCSTWSSCSILLPVATSWSWHSEH